LIGSWFKYANRPLIWSITLVDHVYIRIYTADMANYPRYVLRKAQLTTEEIESNYSQLNSKRLLSLFGTSIRMFHITRAWNRGWKRGKSTRDEHNSSCPSRKYPSLKLTGPETVENMGGLPSIELSIECDNRLQYRGTCIGSRNDRDMTKNQFYPLMLIRNSSKHLSAAK